VKEGKLPARSDRVRLRGSRVSVAKKKAVEGTPSQGSSGGTQSLKRKSSSHGEKRRLSGSKKAGRIDRCQEGKLPGGPAWKKIRPHYHRQRGRGNGVEITRAQKKKGHKRKTFFSERRGGRFRKKKFLRRRLHTRRRKGTPVREEEGYPKEKKLLSFWKRGHIRRSQR